MNVVAFLKEYKDRHPVFQELALFGSRAKGKATYSSDIDIAFRIDIKKLRSPWDYFATLEELKEAIHKQFGLHCDFYDLASDTFTPKEIIYV